MEQGLKDRERQFLSTKVPEISVKSSKLDGIAISEAAHRAGPAGALPVKIAVIADEVKQSLCL